MIELRLQARVPVRANKQNGYHPFLDVTDCASVLLSVPAAVVGMWVRSMLDHCATEA